MRANAGLAKQVLAAPGRTREHLPGSGLAIKTKQAQYCAGAAPDDVELSVRRDEVVGDELGRHTARR